MATKAPFSTINRKTNDRILIDKDRSRPEIVQRLLDRFYNDDNQQRNTAKSNDWFRKIATRMGRVNPEKWFKEDGYKLTTTPVIGRLYMYLYDPLHKKTLDHYDIYPLTFFYDTFSKNGKKYLMGLNMHYLPPKLRMELYRNLLLLRSDSKYRDSTRLKMQWQALSRLSQHPLVVPCVHMYITSHIRSKLVEIPAQDWEMSMFMGTARFRKQSQKKVWAESIKKAKKAKK